jgi:hypothetical protein
VYYPVEINELKCERWRKINGRDHKSCKRLYCSKMWENAVAVHCVAFKIHNIATTIAVADYFKPCLFEKIVYVMNYDLLELELLILISS